MKRGKPSENGAAQLQLPLGPARRPAILPSPAPGTIAILICNANDFAAGALGLFVASETSRNEMLGGMRTAPPQGWRGKLEAFLAAPIDASTPPTAARDETGRLTVISSADLVAHVLMLQPREFDKRRQMEVSAAMRVAGYEQFRRFDAKTGHKPRWWRLRA